MKNIVFFLIFILPATLSSQSKISDIEKNYQKYRETVQSNPDSGLIYIKRAKVLNEIVKSPSWDARIYYGIGYCFIVKQEYEKSQEYFKKAIEYARETDDFNTLSKAYNQIGQTYSFVNDFKNALSNYHSSLKISEQKEELNDNTIAVLSNIADLYILQEDTVSARRYYYQAQKIGEGDGKKPNLAAVYNNLAVSYMKTNIDSTEFYLNKALQIQEENHNYHGQIMAKINLAVTYLNFKSVLNYSTSLRYLRESLELSKAIDNVEAEYFSYYYLGKYYEQAESDYRTALSYYQEAHNILRKGYKNDYTIELYESLSRAYSTLGNFEQAYHYQKIQQNLQDSIFSVEKNKQFHEAQTKFDVERKNNQIQLLNKEKEIQKGNNRLIFIGSILLIVPLLFLAVFYRQRMKYQQTIGEQDKMIFEKEREAIRARNLIEGQNLERGRITKELHDGVGGKLSAIKIKMDQLNTTSIQDPELGECIRQLEDASKEIRVISHELNENKIDKLNFVNLLNHLVKEYRFYFTGEIHLNIYPETKFEQIEGVEKHYLYRTIQEILSNCLKYAEAENIYIDCTFDSGYRLIVEDDGKGFDLSSVKKGMGLDNLHKRIKSLKGNLHIDSVIGRGSSFIIEIPQNGTENT